jgi:hypothetical protein
MHRVSSNNNAPTERIAKWLNNKFTHLPNPPGEWVKNIERVKDITLNEDELLVSLDIIPQCSNSSSYEALKRLVEIHRAGKKK